VTGKQRGILGLAIVAGMVGGGACSDRGHTAQSGGEVVAGTAGGPVLVDARVEDVKLDMPAVRNWFAAMRTLMSGAETDASLQGAVRSEGNETTQQTIAKLESSEKARAILHHYDLSPRDYVLTMTALLQAVAAEGALRADTPGALPPGVSRENVQFVREHRAELEPLLQGAGLTH